MALVANNGTGTLDLFLPIRRGLVGASASSLARFAWKARVMRW